jgi:hypothetical protein
LRRRLRTPIRLLRPEPQFYTRAALARFARLPPRTDDDRDLSEHERLMHACLRGSTVCAGAGQAIRVVDRREEQAMVRSRVIQTVRYGYFREARNAIEELNRVSREKGLAEASCWSPVAGTNNELIIEVEHPTLADFERWQAAFYADPDTMKVWRNAAQYIIEGSGRSELLETAPSLA